jgi:hypothetical protein
MFFHVSFFEGLFNTNNLNGRERVICASQLDRFRRQETDSPLQSNLYY